MLYYSSGRKVIALDIRKAASGRNKATRENTERAICGKIKKVVCVCVVIKYNERERERLCIRYFFLKMKNKKCVGVHIIL